MRHLLPYLTLIFLLTECKESCDNLYDKGYVAFEQSDYELAIDYFSKSIKEECRSYNLFIKRGISYRYVHKLDLALNDYFKALEIDSSKSDVFNNIGTVYEMQKEKDLALYYFTKSIQIDSSYSLGYYNLGQHYFYSGEFELAISSYEKSQSHSDIYNIDIPIKICMSYDSLHNDTMSVRYLTEYANYIKEAEVYFDLANRQLSLNMSDSAIKYVNKSLSLDSNVHIYNLLGLAYDKNGQLNKAVDYYYKALEYGEKQALITYNMSYVLEALGRLEEAIYLIEKCDCYNHEYNFDLEKRRKQLINRLIN